VGSRQWAVGSRVHPATRERLKAKGERGDSHLGTRGSGLEASMAEADH